MTTEPVTTAVMADECANRDRNFGFVIGAIVGSAVGVGLGMLFAPRAVLDLRTRVGDSARGLGKAASDQYERASRSVSAAVDEMTRKGRDLRNNLSDVVVRGAQDVERVAKNVRT